MLSLLATASLAMGLAGSEIGVTLEVPDYRVEDQRPRHRLLGNARGCYVLMRNLTNHPLQVLCDLNSLGDSAMTYQAVGASGKGITLSGSGEAYSKNFPSTVRLLPGEVCVRPFRLRQSEMKRLMALGRMVTIHAIFTQDASIRRVMRSAEVWVGVSASPPVVVDVSL